MDYERAVARYQQLMFGHNITLGFVHPVMSVLLAVASRKVAGGLEQRVCFAGNAHGYAANTGLLDVLKGRYEVPTGGGLQGQTYTCLTRLASEHEVDACNATINNLINNQLQGRGLIFTQQFKRVIGELHDNVASHSYGEGFSCAQVYSYNNSNPCITFAIADGGCGLLANAKKKCSQIINDEEAIKWCLKRGNTSAPNYTGWEQRLPEDSVISPYPTSVSTRQSENHHMGIGLDELVKLVKSTGGELWIWSGCSQFRLSSGGTSDYRKTRCPNTGQIIEWQGVAIEMSIPVIDHVAEINNDAEKHEDLGRRFGL